MKLKKGKIIQFEGTHDKGGKETSQWLVVSVQTHNVLLHKLIGGVPDSRVRWCPDKWKAAHKGREVRKRDRKGA